MAEVACPLGDCTYTGPLRSVEAHISGNQDPDHKGEVGRTYRQDLREQLEAEDPARARVAAGEAEGSEEALVEPTEESTEDGEESEVPEAASEEGGQGSVPPGWMLLFATVALLVIVLATSVTSVEVSDGEADQEDEADQEPTAQGLIS